jgi:hypothetical protein
MSSSGSFPPAVSFPADRDNRANWKRWGFERKKRATYLAVLASNGVRAGANALALLWRIYSHCVFTQIHSAVRATLRRQPSDSKSDWRNCWMLMRARSRRLIAAGSIETHHSTLRIYRDHVDRPEPALLLARRSACQPRAPEVFNPTFSAGPAAPHRPTPPAMLASAPALN